MSADEDFDLLTVCLGVQTQKVFAGTDMQHLFSRQSSSLFPTLKANLSPWL